MHFFAQIAHHVEISGSTEPERGVLGRPVSERERAACRALARMAVASSYGPRLAIPCCESRRNRREFVRALHAQGRRSATRNARTPAAEAARWVQAGIVLSTPARASPMTVRTALDVRVQACPNRLRSRGPARLMPACSTTCRPHRRDVVRRPRPPNSCRVCARFRCGNTSRRVRKHRRPACRLLHARVVPRAADLPTSASRQARARRIRRPAIARRFGLDAMRLMVARARRESGIPG